MLKVSVNVNEKVHMSWLARAMKVPHQWRAMYSASHWQRLGQPVWDVLNREWDPSLSRILVEPSNVQDVT
jgi:hypothetical protein